MDLEQKSILVSIWEDVEISQAAKSDVAVSELYLTRIYPSLAKADELSCRVEFPELVSQGWMGWKRFYTYKITSTLNKSIYKIRRRFKDFERLHRILVSLYPGFSIPVLPPKAYLNYHSVEHLKARRSHIEFYLNYISQHFLLKTSQVFIKFLSVKEFEPVKFDNDSKFSWNFEEVYDKTVAEIVASLEIACGKRSLEFEGVFGEMFSKLKNFEDAFEHLALSLSNTGSALKENTNKWDGLRSKGFCDWLFGLCELQHKVSISLETFSFDVYKDLLKVKGLLNALEVLKSYKIKQIGLENLIARKKEKLEKYSNLKYSEEIRQTSVILDQIHSKILEIQENVESEYHDFLTSHQRNCIASLIQLTEANFSLYARSVSHILDNKHKNII